MSKPDEVTADRPALAAWCEKIEEYSSGKATGRAMSRAAASSHAARNFPEMREAVVAEANRARRGEL